MRKIVRKSYEYIESLGPTENEPMQKSRQASESLGLDAISLSATEGSLIQFFIGSCGAKKVVEIGTLTGLSALYILRALPSDGQLWTLEKSTQHADLAAEVLTDERCRILVGDAEIKMQELNSEGPFDVIFIDGNKAAYLTYFQWAVSNTRPGGLILVDNVFLSGAVWGDQTTQRFNEKQIAAVKKMNQLAFEDSKLSSVIIPTDEGLLVSRKI